MSEPLFDLDPIQPLRMPHLLDVGAGAISYAKYAPKRPVRCDDCNRVTFEQLTSGEGAPLARSARFTRTQGDSRLLLCVEHKNLREIDEQELAVKAELERLNPHARR